MTSEIETLDESSGEGGSASLIEFGSESTLEATYQDAETLSTFQQAF